MVNKLINVIVIICFAISIYTNYQYSKQIGQLRLELSNRPINDVESQSNVSVEYVPKANPYDNDIEIKTSDDIKVKVDDTEYKIPVYIKEENRLDKGKIIVEKQADTTIELTNIVDKLADEKAYRYSRTGTFDVGMLYNKKESDLYGGVRFNTKAYDIGYYRQIDGNDWLIGFHYKF